MKRTAIVVAWLCAGMLTAWLLRPTAAAPQSEYLPHPLEIRVYGQSTWLADAPVTARVVVLNHDDGQPCYGAAVRFLLEDPAGKAQTVDLGRSYTDRNGTVRARLRVPDVASGSRTLVVRASDKDLGVNSVSRSLEIVRRNQILLTTDKPLYQPAQTIHIRALALRRPDNRPVAGQEMTLEVADSKGNKVFKRTQQTSEFGLAAAQFTLADEINLGTYEVRAILSDTTQTKSVTVDRYVLPKFKISPTLDKPYYLPGEKAHGSLSVQYFFGEPVTGGKVTVVVSTFDVELKEIARLEGKTDNNGSFEFDVELPKHFVGQPLEEGKAFLQFEISVVDTADHEEKTTVTRSVAADPIEVAVIPESGELIPGIQNLVYVVTSYPDGSPAKTRVSLVPAGSAAGDAATYPTSEAGVARVPITPRDKPEYVVTAVGEDGQQTRRRIELPRTGATSPVLLRPDKALYTVGETLKATIFAPQSKSGIFFDIVRDNQTVLTDVARLENGQAEVSVDLTPGYSGTLQLHAYRIEPDGEIVRDTRVVYVRDASDLAVRIEKSAESYLPGGEAQLVLSVSDRKGNPVPSALGVEVVDESVFALSENQPGLERVYFTLQRELMTPRYEIHGFEPDQVIMTFTDRDKPAEVVKRQEDAAAALFAAVADTDPFSLTVNSWEEGREAALAKWQEHATADATAIMQALDAFSKQQKGRLQKWPTLEELVAQGKVAREASLDPLGNPYRCNISQATGLELSSAGMDQKWDTADDLAWRFWSAVEEDEKGQQHVVARVGGWRRERNGRWGGEMMFEALAMDGAGPRLAGAGGPMPVPAVAKAQAAPEAATALGAENGGGGAEPVRIREWFPETLYVNPAIITDARGRAELTIPMADSITTWRLTAMANSRTGMLGSMSAPIKVFQDFFVDIDLPVQLTEGDQVSIPVAVYNYLPTEQTVRIAMTKEDWFTLAGEAEKSLSIGTREVSVVYFPLTVKAFGNHTLTVHAYGTKMSDAVKRQIRVVPNGKQLEQSVSDRLEGTVRKTVVIPDAAIEGASTILVKVYPGILSQVVEGLDAILQMPFGCFEQTSSTTYPNILVLDYLRSTKQGSPEIEMKATEYISTGYQRLLSFEVQGGGFEWFGNAPANKVLTAYGVLEFNDMAKVYDVDPAVISRTQQWLIGKQEADGTWTPDPSYLHAEAWGRIQNNKLLPTAYVSWALAESGNRGSEVQKAIAYVRGHLGDSDDPYTLGLCANALVAAEPKAESTAALLRRLVDMRKTEDKKSWWESKVSTMCHGSGESADIEATALIGYALIRAGRYPDVASEVINWLVSKKDPRGTWHSTQATVLALKTLLASMGTRTSQVNGEATVLINGQVAGAFAITPQNSDVLQQVDLRQYVHNGANDIEIRFAGEGSTLYQISSLFYIPWKMVGAEQELLSIDVAYDREELTTKDIITSTVTVKNNRPGKAKMVVLDLGIPPGFTVVPGDLAEYVGQIFAKYTQTSRQLIIYFDEVDGAKPPITFSYRLKAKYPLRAQTPRSRVYEYYNPDVEGFAEPEELVVKQG